jgi:trans-aconitate methyltransferase
MAPRAVEWRHWLDRWDEQQTSFNADRERRFSVMFDLAEASAGRRFRALDLGCGPGSLSARLLKRFPVARSVAVDYDPVVQHVGQGALGTVGGRLTWVDAKLGRAGWTKALPPGRFDVALSTTALHWLPPDALRRLYLDLHRLLRSGGIFLNGDQMPWGSGEPRLRALSEKVRRLRFHGRALGSEWKGWRAWWADAKKVPELKPYFRLQAQREASHPKRESPSLDVHVRSLRAAGFRDVAVVWQDLENRVLYALR